MQHFIHVLFTKWKSEQPHNSDGIRLHHFVNAVLLLPLNIIVLNLAHAFLMPLNYQHGQKFAEKPATQNLLHAFCSLMDSMPIIFLISNISFSIICKNVHLHGVEHMSYCEIFHGF